MDHLGIALAILGHLCIGQQGGVHLAADGPLIHAGADEDQLLPPVAKVRVQVKVADDDAALVGIHGPLIVGDACPPARRFAFSL